MSLIKEKIGEVVKKGISQNQAIHNQNEQIIGAIRKMQELYLELRADFNELNKTLLELSSRPEIKHDEVVNDVLSQIPKPKDGKNADEVKIIDTVLSKIPKPKDGTDGLNGKNADEDLIVSRILKQIPKPKDGQTPIKGIDYLTKEQENQWKNDIINSIKPQTGEEIIDKINNLPIEPSKQIDARHIKGLVKDKVKLGGLHRGGSKLTKETPVGSVNATNTVFTVSKEPDHVVVDGITYFDGQGYTYSSLTITTEIPPSKYIRAYV